jgi:hypothetical protein
MQCFPALNQTPGLVFAESGLKKHTFDSSRNSLDPTDLKIVSRQTLNNLDLSAFEMGQIKSASRLQKTPGSSENFRKGQRDLVTCHGPLQVGTQAPSVRRPVRGIGGDDVEAVGRNPTRNTLKIVRL